MKTQKVKHTAKLTAKSIESSGLPTDYKKAIAEYIWNGFDAGASIVNLNFEYNDLGYINKFNIEDNGCGIKINNIDDTFGNFNVSLKTLSFSDSGFIKGKKGKGRFSFVIFCNNAVWNTIFKAETGELLNYKIEINRDNSQDFSIDERLISKSKITGTTVSFNNFHSLTGDLLDNNDFYEFLASEFGWFLYLNKENDYKIVINNISLDYFDIIEENEDKFYSIENYSFKVSFLRWKIKIGEKYYYYFLNNNKKQIDRKHTSFNNKTENFHHSLYIESEYFNNYQKTKEDIPTLDFADRNQTDHIFKTLLNLLNEYVGEKEKVFIKNYLAEKLIEEYNRKKVFPDFKNNNYEQLRKKDLENVVKELYSVQPKIFQGLKDTQSKTILGFLNLILDSEQRENVLNIIDNVVNLSDDERKELANVLQKTKLSHITELVIFLENRFVSVETLKNINL